MVYLKISDGIVIDDKSLGWLCCGWKLKMYIRLLALLKAYFYIGYTLIYEILFLEWKLPPPPFDMIVR